MKRQRLVWFGSGCLSLFVLLLGGGMGWYRYVAEVPAVVTGNPVSLRQNASEDFLAAVALIPADSDAAATSPRPVGIPPDSPSRLDAPALRNLIHRSQPALRRFRFGLTREFQAFPTGDRWSETAGYRRLARLVSYEADLALREGRPDDALGIGMEILRLGAMLPKGGRLLDALVGQSVDANGRRCVERALPSAGGEALERAARELHALDRTAPTYLDAVRRERQVRPPEFVANLRDAPPEAGVRALWKSAWESRELPDQEALLYVWAYLTTPRQTILAEFLRNLDAEIERAEKPYQNRGPLPPESSNPVIQEALTFTDDGFLYSATRSVALRHVLTTQLAIRAYARRQGRLPANLAALVPRYLPAVPGDPFASAPLLYRVVNGQPFVYSRGPDGDDDGGKDMGVRLTPDGDGDLASMRRF